MVSLLIVSHSEQLAAGVCEFVGQVAGDDVKIVAAGGTPDGALGTNIDRILAGLESLRDSDGILVLVDMGSAVLSVETALDLYDGPPVQISNAPIVEGAYLAALEAAVEGATLDQVAEGALQAKEMVKVHS